MGQSFLEDEADADFADLLVEAEEGNPQAQFECGMMLILGMGLKQDVAEGINRLVEAAMAGHAKARAEMESCYFFREKNYIRLETKEWLALANRQDDPGAFDYYLAYFYHMGILVERRTDMAMHHLARAADLGNADAQPALSRFHRQCIGIVSA
jgi:TPR repeat protein